MRLLPLFCLLALPLAAQRTGNIGVVRTDVDGGSFGLSYKNEGKDSTEHLGFEIMLAGSQFVPKGFGAGGTSSPSSILVGLWLLYTRPGWHIEKLKFYAKAGIVSYNMTEDFAVPFDGNKFSGMFYEMGGGIGIMATPRIGASVDLLPTYWRGQYSGTLEEFLNSTIDTDGFHISIYMRVLWSFARKE